MFIYLFNFYLFINFLCFSESLIEEIALIFVNEGYLDAGYNYINLDDCWMKSQRESNGQLLPDFQRFPNGIKHLANYVMFQTFIFF